MHVQLFPVVRDAYCYSEAGSKAKQIEDYSSSEDEDETADQKRKRLAQEHLEKLKAYS